MCIDRRIIAADVWLYFNEEQFFPFYEKSFEKIHFFDALMPVADSLKGGKFEETIIGKTPKIQFSKK